MKIKTDLVEAHIIKVENNIVEYLIMQRAPGENYPGIWQMVTGKIDNNEKAYEAALREIKEETNLTVNKFFIVPNVNKFYNAADDSVTIIPVFVAITNNPESVKISFEHSEYKWCRAEEAKKLFASQGQRDSVDIIEDYFTGIKSNLFFEEIKIELKQDVEKLDRKTKDERRAM